MVNGIEVDDRLVNDFYSYGPDDYDSETFGEVRLWHKIGDFGCVIGKTTSSGRTQRYKFRSNRSHGRGDTWGPGRYEGTMFGPGAKFHLFRRTKYFCISASSLYT